MPPSAARRRQHREVTLLRSVIAIGMAPASSVVVLYVLWPETAIARGPSYMPERRRDLSVSYLVVRIPPE